MALARRRPLQSDRRQRLGRVSHAPGPDKASPAAAALARGGTSGTGFTPVSSALSIFGHGPGRRRYHVAAAHRSVE